MKSILKFLNLLTLIALVAMFGLRDVLPAKAVAPDQTISIVTHAPSTAANGESFTVNATADSGLDVSYSAVGACTNLGANFTMTSDSGECTVQYDQAGGGGYDPAQRLTETVTAQPASTPTATETATETQSPTGTMTSTSTATPTITVTATVTATPTSTATPSLPAFYVSTIGNDTNSCTSPTETCLTINGALDKAHRGDTIKVAAGTYTSINEYPVAAITKSITLLGGWNADFSAQDDTSIIDGQKTHVGISVWHSYDGKTETVLIDHFTIQHCSKYGAIENNELLTLNNSVVKNNSGGLGNSGILTINYSTFTGNTNGAIANDYNGTITLNNSLVDKNMAGVLSSDSASIDNENIFTINNSVVSANTGNNAITANKGNLLINNSTIVNNEGPGIKQTREGLVTLNSSTITGNGFGILITYTYVGSWISIQNSIIVGNKTDCQGTINRSKGFNLLGYEWVCNINRVSSDIKNVKDAKLGHLTGAFPGYIPLLPGSPAIDRGSSKALCLPTDQRGLKRPQGSRCDIGAYEYRTPGPATTLGIFTGSGQSVSSNATYTIPLTIYVSDSFGDPIKNKTVTFKAPTSGASGKFAANNITTTATTDDSGIAIASVFTANNTPGIFNVIATVNGLPGSASFTLTNLPVPTTLSPSGITLDATPTYRWSAVTNAAQYQYELWQGTTLVYSDTTLPTSCTATTCSTTPATTLIYGDYQWRVTALVDGLWQQSSALTPFHLQIAPKSGLWVGKGMEFYVNPAHTKVVNFAIYVFIKGCGSYKITYTQPLSVESFSAKGKFYFTGKFGSITQAKGTLGLNYYNLLGCGYIKGGPFNWTATWKNSSQPATIMNTTQESIVTTIVIPETGSIADPDSYVVERITP